MIGSRQLKMLAWGSVAGMATVVSVVELDRWFYPAVSEDAHERKCQECRFLANELIAANGRERAMHYDLAVSDLRNRAAAGGAARDRLWWVPPLPDDIDPADRIPPQNLPVPVRPAAPIPTPNREE